MVTKFSTNHLLLYSNFSDTQEIDTIDKPIKLFSEIVFCGQSCSDLMWEKNCSSDWEKLLKFEAEGQEFAKFLRSLEQFIQTVKGQNKFMYTGT